MKTKKLLAWLLAFAMCFALVACKDSGKPENDDPASSAAKDTTEPSAAPATPSEPTSANPTGPTTPITKGPLLYKVTDEQGNVIWLFGSIHVGREDFYPLPAYILNAFDGADSLAVEVDLIAFEKDINQQTQALSAMMYKNNTTIRNNIPEGLYDSAVAVLKANGAYPSSALDIYCAIFWSSMIDSILLEKIGGNSDLGVDQHLLERAYANKKEVLQIESALAQYQMMAGFSGALQTFLLESSIEAYKNQDVAKEDLQKLTNLWISGDEQAFAAYLASEDDDMSADEQKLYNEYNQAVIVTRNLNMTNYAENALKSGKEVFICVGAAHIVGDGAMAQMLAQRGYTVERVTQ